jgi:hypothetical protein
MNLTRGFSSCFACSHLERHLDTLVPISYSVGHEYLHHILADYKRLQGPRAAAAGRQVQAILSMFLQEHERCVARAAGVERFDLVTTVPSSDLVRDAHHPLRGMVSKVRQIGDRHERLLRRTSDPVEPRAFDGRRFRATHDLAGRNVLLIDDMWTTGASMESAAAALKRAGAAVVGGLVIGRHLNRDWHENDEHLDALPFAWDRCSVCAGIGGSTSRCDGSPADPAGREPLDRAA